MMKTLLARFGQWAAALPGHLRHPTVRGVAWGLATLPVIFVIYVLALIPFTPSIDDLRKAKEAKPSVVLSADGEELAVFKRANREWVKLNAISPHVVAALIATEDHRFYEHRGMDIKRTLSSVVHTFTGSPQGGSTLTQQLARNLYPEEIGRSRTLTRKLKEAITALKIESVYTKDEILETYLNTVPFLFNAYGIEVAARTYFDKTADSLDVLESATLVGMLKGTSYYNPVTRPERALQRRNTVLGQMAKHQKLDVAQLDSLKKQPLNIEFERQNEQLGSAPHLAQYLRKWMIDWADRNDYNIYADGLVLRTTLDSRLQHIALQAVAQQADKLQALADAEWSMRSGWAAKAGPHRDLVLAFVRETSAYKAARDAGQSDEQALKQLQADAAFMQTLRDDKTRLQAGFMALDPKNGQVLAWVGSRDFSQDQFDHVQQARRQPGSTFKPFVYGAAFENGSRASDTFVDGAVEIPMGDGTFWRPTDGSGPSDAPLTLREGLMYSKNTITAQVMHVVGPARVARLAQAMGVRQSKLEEVPSLALGTSPVTLKEMVAAYGTLANDGRYTEPVMIKRVEDRHGEVLESFDAKVPETVMSTTVAQTLIDILRGAVDQGTGTAIRTRFGIQADVAGKTGTTQDNTDGWFILMHRQLVAGAWVGFNDNRVTMGSRWGQGAQSALPMVGEFFRQGLKAKLIDTHLQFDAPRGAGLNDPARIPNSGEVNGSLSGQESGTPGGQPLANAAGTVPGPGASPAPGWQPAPTIRYVTIQVPPEGGARPETAKQPEPEPPLPAAGVPLNLLPAEPARPRDVPAVEPATPR